MRSMIGSGESKWKRHTVLSNDSGYDSTGNNAERNGWHSAEVSCMLKCDVHVHFSYCALVNYFSVICFFN